MFNKVVLVGNLTRDVELRSTPNGAVIGNSAIAVTHKYSVNGERREETCFVDITFWGKSAEIANLYLHRGSKVLIEGRLRFDQWQDQNGQNRSKHSVQVESMEMLDSKPQGEGQVQGGYVSAQTYAQNMAQPAPQPQPAPRPVAQQAPAAQPAQAAPTPRPQPAPQAQPEEVEIGYDEEIPF